ncbi:hypothetical protein SUDANB120_01714 [Streptomyces sp. enrichment culture]|uniref:hypothetical protein n=1 Tax=Streptomyces sp. enrichment culture TaxID=1795815 RepID=UPI003F578CAC
MTEAVTTPPPAEPPSPPGAPGGSAAGTALADIRDAAAITLATGAAGALLGVLWAWLAPRTQYVSNGEAVFLRNTESEARVGADGTFLLLGVGLGVLSAVLVFLWRRRGGVAQAIGLGIGSCFASLLGWRAGLRLGPPADIAASAAEAGKGVPFDAPLQLLAHGALLAWPMAALAAYLGLVAVWGPQDPARHEEDDEPAGQAVYPPPYVHAEPQGGRAPRTPRDSGGPQPPAGPAAAGPPRA